MPTEVELMKLVDDLNTHYYNVTLVDDEPPPFDFWSNGLICGILYMKNSVWCSDDSDVNTIKELTELIINHINTLRLRQKQFVNYMAYKGENYV